MSTAGGRIQLVDLTKSYGRVEAVRGISLEIPAGEFFSLLGPSGCGKTTTLKMIGGFERPTSGEILLDGTDMANTPPHKRSVNTVFQSYALFPHLSVGDNVGFGLRFTDVSKSESRRRMGEALELVHLEGYESRRPTQLSGGQQQRVALARALVLNPSVLLLDEPLGALDARLRKVLQVELKQLQEEVGITFVYVTHDQEEALTMSDRIAVMSGGTVEQVGRPTEVYEQPATSYVAEFLGVSNLMDGVIDGAATGEQCTVRVGEFELTARGRPGGSEKVNLAIRPERVSIEEHGSTGENRIPGTIERVVYVGPVIQVHVHLAEGTSIQAMVANRGSESSWSQGSQVSVHMPPDGLRVLPKGSET